MESEVFAVGTTHRSKPTSTNIHPFFLKQKKSSLVLGNCSCWVTWAPLILKKELGQQPTAKVGHMSGILSLEIENLALTFSFKVQSKHVKFLENQ